VINRAFAPVEQMLVISHKFQKVGFLDVLKGLLEGIGKGVITN
jgi:hypothetical protein